jgi:hypothetical protein
MGPAVGLAPVAFAPVADPCLEATLGNVADASCCLARPFLAEAGAQRDRVGCERNGLQGGDTGRGWLVAATGGPDERDQGGGPGNHRECNTDADHDRAPEAIRQLPVAQRLSFASSFPSNPGGFSA